MNAPPKISIIICSWQAPASLDEALKSIYTQKGDVSFEAVLVNNGFPIDRASALRNSFAGILIVDEPTPGLAHARRAGFRAAKGEFFVCIDDDNLLGEDFLHSMSALITQHPNLGCICPVVVPLWEKMPALWLQEFGICCLSYTKISISPPTEKKLEKIWHSPDFNGWPWPPGGGMIFHRSVAENYLSMKECGRLKLGRIGNSLGGSEDQDIYCRFVRLGLDAAHSEKLVVLHQIQASRTRMSYLFRLNFRMTQDWAALERFWQQENHPFGASTLRWHIRELFHLPVRYIRRQIIFPQFLLEWVRHAGFLWGWTRDSLRNPKQMLKAFAGRLIRKTRIRDVLLISKQCGRQRRFAWQLFKSRALHRPVIIVQRHAGIGDVVCTFPSVEVLRRNEPGAVVVYETRRVNIPVVECCPAVDLVVEQETPLANHCRRFLRPERIVRPFLPDELNPPKPRDQIHLVDEFARSFNLPALGEVSAHLKVPAKERMQIRRRLREAYLNYEPIAVIHSGPTWQVKEWPAANWLELVKRMKDSLGMTVIQIGQDSCATGEIRLSARVEGALDWVGQLTIKEMLALLENAKIFVGIDSGMLHLAGAVSTPCVGLFGPTNPKCFLPRESPAVGVTSNVECLGCHHNVKGPMHWQSGCPNAIRCMSGLSVEEVFLACSRLLSPSLENCKLENAGALQPQR